MEVSAEITPIGFTEHYMSEGVYTRVLHIKEGDFAIGALHLTTHMSILLKGKVTISIDGESRTMEAPHIFEALAGSRKIAVAHTDVQIMNIIPTELKDIEEIEKAVIDKTVPDNISQLLEPLKLLKGA